MYTPKVEVTLRGHICDVHRNLHLLAIFPYSCRRNWIVYSCQDHRYILGGFEVKWQEDPIDVLGLAIVDAVKDF